MKTLLLLLTLSFFAQTSFASIICQSARMDKSIKISNSSVTFINSDYESNSPQRVIASINSVRTRITAKGLTKILNYEGHKHTIYINNTSKFSSFDDYITIRSKKGHEVIYPLECSNS